MASRIRWGGGVALLSAALIGVYLVLRQSGQPRSTSAAVVASLYVACALLALLVAVGIERRRRRAVEARHGPANGRVQTYRFQEAVELPHPPAVVWSLVAPAEHAPLLTPDIVAGSRVPGSREGVGERQEFVLRDGSRTTVEVVAWEPGRRVVVEPVSPQQDVPTRHVCTVEPLGNGSLLTYQQEWDVPKRRRLNADEWEADWRRQVREFLHRVRVTLET